MRSALLSLVICAFFSASAVDSSRPSPPFSILRAEKNAAPIALTQYRGKIVALAFIHTTCPHCQELTRTMIPIARDYAPRGVQFLECAFNTGAKDLVSGFVAQFHPGFPVGWQDSAAVMTYLRYTPISPMLYVPHMVFLDAGGVIRGDYPGESDFFKKPDASIRQELDKLLKAAAAAAATK